MSLGRSKRRNFTKAARAAAIEARQRKREMALPPDTPEVFVIRRFGAVVLDKGETGHASPAAARSAGLEALSGRGMMSDAPLRGRTPPQAQAWPRSRVLTRGPAHGSLIRLCEAVLWSMARRRMP